MPTPGMVTDMIISRKVNELVENEFLESEREDAWKYYKLAYRDSISILRIFSLMTALISAMLILATPIVFFNGKEGAGFYFSLGLMVILATVFLLKLRKYLLERSVLKLKALINSNPLYWGKIGNTWKRIWIEAGQNISNGFGGVCPSQTKVIDRPDGIVLLIR